MMQPLKLRAKNRMTKPEHADACNGTHLHIAWPKETLDEEEHMGKEFESGQFGGHRIYMKQPFRLYVSRPFGNLKAWNLTKRIRTEPGLPRRPSIRAALRR